VPPPLFRRKDPAHPSLRELTKGAERAVDPEQSAALYTQAGDLALSLGKRDKALTLFRRAVAKVPLHAPACERIEAMLRERGDLAALCQEQGRRLAVLSDARGDARDLASAHVSLAQTAEQIGRMEEAFASYEKAFDLDPSLVDVARAAHRTGAAVGQWERVVDILERSVAVTTDRVHRAELLSDAALLCRDHLGDLNRAIAFFERATRADPDNLAARRSLSDTLGQRALTQTDQDLAARDRYVAAEVLATMVDKLPPEERLACVEAALDVAPEHIDALRLLEGLVPDDTERLLDRFRRHVESFPDGPISDELRSRLGQELLVAGRRDEALEWFEQLAARGDVDSALVVIEQQAAAERTEEARARATELLARTPEEEQLSIMSLVFTALRDHAPGEAHAWGRDILISDPTDEAALDFCIAWCEQTEDWPQLEELLSEVAARSEVGPDVQHGLLTRLARLQEQRLGDLDQALATWRVVQELAGSTHAKAAIDERIRLSEVAEHWDEVAELLEGVVSKEPEAKQRILFYRKLAEVHQRRRFEPDSAARALLALLRLGVDETSILDDLTDVLRAAGAGSEPVGAIHTFAEGAPPGLQGVLFRVLATLFDEWSRPTEAFDAWGRVRAALGSDPHAVERQVTLAIEMGKYREALDLLAEQAAEAGPQDVVRIQKRIAEVARDRLADHERAADALSIALEASPHDTALAQELSTALGRAGRFGEKTVILRLLVREAPDDESRREYQEQLAHVLADAIREEDEAMRLWQEIVAGTDDAAVLDRLARDARRDGAAERLDVILARHAALERQPERRWELILERAEVLVERMDCIQVAIAVLTASIDDDASAHFPTLDLLATLCAKTGDVRNLSRAIELQVPLVPEKDRWLLHRRLADIYEGPLEHPVNAVRALTSWEELRPYDIDPRQRLVTHLGAADSWEGLLKRVDRLLEIARRDTDAWLDAAAEAVDGGSRARPKPGREGPLAWFYLELAERARNPAQRITFVTRASDHFVAAGTPAEAFAAAARALSLAGPEDALLARADRLAIEAGAAAELDGLYTHFAERAETPEARRALVLRHAKLLAEAPGRLSDALDLLLAASAADPMDAELLEAMESIAPRCGRLPELVSAYAARAAMVGAGSRAVFLLLRAILLSHLAKESDDVSGLLADAIGHCGDDPEQLHRVESAARDLGRKVVSQLVRVYEAGAKAEGASPEAASRLLVRAAHLLSEELSAEGVAFSLLKRALALTPTDEKVLDALEEIAVKLSVVMDLDAHLDEMVAATMSDDVAAVLLRRRGRLLSRHLAKPSEAADVYQRLWGLRPDDPDVHSDLRLCLIQADRIHDLISATERALTLHPDPAHRLQLMRDVAELWEEGAHNEYEALDAWKRVLKHSPEDVVAKEAIARLGRPRSRRPPEAESADEVAGNAGATETPSEGEDDG